MLAKLDKESGTSILTDIYKFLLYLKTMSMGGFFYPEQTLPSLKKSKLYLFKHTQLFLFPNINENLSGFMQLFTIVSALFVMISLLSML